MKSDCSKVKKTYDFFLLAVLLAGSFVFISIVNKWCYLYVSVLIVLSAITILAMFSIVKLFKIDYGNIFAGKLRFCLAIAYATLFYYNAVFVVNFDYLPGKFQIVSLIADVLLGFSAAALAAALARPAKIRRWVFFAAGAVISFIYVAALQGGHRTEISSRERLTSLPYLTGVARDKNNLKNGAVLREGESGGKGINIFTSLDRPAAYLMAMNGEIIHEWKVKGDGLYGGEPWQYVELEKNCDLLVIVKDYGLAKLTYDSEVLWKVDMRFHHDVDVAADGTIWTLAMKERWISYRGIPVPILDDNLIHLSKRGEILSEASFYDILKNHINASSIDEIIYQLISPRHMLDVLDAKIRNEPWPKQDKVYDIFHVNSIQLIAGENTKTEAGSEVLFCSKYMNCVGIIDLQGEKLIWHWGEGELDYPHHPTLLADGDVLIFDNGTKRGYSRILEIEPDTGETVWEYEGIPPSSFNTFWGGSCQRLENGDTLIAESEKGYAFEVDGSGDVVWEYYNKDRKADGVRATIYRMTRIEDVSDYPCLKAYGEERTPGENRELADTRENG